ncbi:MAG: hypothetical protein AAF756_22375 [Pseudomonadota bacterium]
MSAKARYVLAVRFSSGHSDSSFATDLTQLRYFARADTLETASEPSLAHCDVPFTLPDKRRN